MNTSSRLLIVALLTANAFTPQFAMAADDPSMHQIYEAAESGHLDRAQEMIGEVLRDHPNSGKAHYVAAELDAKQHNYGAARSELHRAEQLQPGLPFARADAVRALRAELGESQGGAARTESGASESGGGSHFPIWPIVFFVVIIAVIWMIFRRRQQQQTMAAPYYGPGGSGPMGYGAPPTGGGIGSSIASGLAVGAGVVAGEEIARHLLDGGERERRFEDSSRNDSLGSGNSDMGGNDFGVSDSSSWDSGGSSDFGGGGSDDWN